MQTTIWWQLVSFQKMKDRSYKITFESGELLPEQLLVLDQLFQKAVFLLIGENPVDKLPDDLPQAIEQWAEKENKKKSLSKRQRDVIYVYWNEKADKKKYPTSNDFYEHAMENNIQKRKDLLD